MSYSPTSPIAGAAQTGFTSPTYTLTSDTAPDSNGVQHAVTAVGGTQTGVTTHSVSSPFTVTFFRPKNLRTLGSPNPVTGVINQVPYNTYKLITRKGVTPLDGQPKKPLLIRTFIEVPAGSDEADAANVKAALSAHAGLLYESSDDIGSSLLTGIV